MLFVVNENGTKQTDHDSRSARFIKVMKTPFDKRAHEQEHKKKDHKSRNKHRSLTCQLLGFSV